MFVRSSDRQHATGRRGPSTIDEPEPAIDNLQAIPDPAAAVAFDSGEILACNEAFVGLLGGETSDLVDRSALELCGADGAATLREVMEAVEGGDVVRGVELTLERGDGEVVETSLSANLLREGDAPVGARLVFRDITELKEAQETLLARTERLERSNEELEQFAYLASHDLQEPLRMVASYTQLLARRYEDELDEQARRYIDFAVEGAERMKALLNDLLEYSRLGRDADDFEEVDLGDVMDVVEANLRVRIGEVGAEIHGGELPTVVGSQSQLVQVFQNLVENALKFNDSETPRVDVEARREGERCVVSVADNGIGMETDHADRIFQVFQRLNERGEYDGTGIGLAVVKKAIDAHGGSVEVHSAEGEGTTFEFDLEVAT